METVLGILTTMLGHAALQCHLLAVRPWSLDELVRAGNECLQVPVAQRLPQKYQPIEENEEEQVSWGVQITSKLVKLAKPLRTVLELVMKQACRFPGYNKHGVVDIKRSWHTPIADWPLLIGKRLKSAAVALMLLVVYPFPRWYLENTLRSVTFMVCWISRSLPRLVLSTTHR